MNITLTGLSGADNFLQLFGVVVLFLIVLVITYFTTKFVGGIKMGTLQESNFKVIDSYKISQNKFLQIIQIGKRYFVISVGKDSIQLLTELNRDEIFIKDKTNGNTFQDIFKTFKKQNEKEEKNDDLYTGEIIDSKEEYDPDEIDHH